MNIAHLTFNNYILKIGGQYKLLHQQVDLIQISTVSRTCSSNIEKKLSQRFPMCLDTQVN